MTRPWLSVVGIGEDGLDGLPGAACTLIREAECLIGGARHLALVPETGAERLAWPSPFGDILPLLEARRGRRVCVLASGDPMWFGVGVTVRRRFTSDDLTLLPHPGAFSLAAARLGWALQEATCLSLHGRPLPPLTLQLWPGHRLIVLSEDGSTPAKLAGFLTERGFGPSRMVVLEHLGGPAERRREATAAAWGQDTANDLNTIAMELSAEKGTQIRPRLAGLPDDAFHHDGQLTKREIRAVALAVLAPWPGALLWDIGAGCGSVAIEWARADGRAVAVERDAARCDLIARNAAAFGVPRIDIVRADAHAALGGLAGPPDAVFVGGGVSDPRLLRRCWACLAAGGRLVAHAVTAEGEAVLLDWQAKEGGALTRISVSHLAPTGRFHSWHPLRTVTQYAGVKP